MRHAQRSARTLPAGLFPLCRFRSLSGCDDESKTSGTMVRSARASQAHLKSKIESYKGGSPKAKGKGKAPEGPAEKK